MAPPRSNRTCEIDGCRGKHLAHGFCRKHYLRKYRHGSPHTLKLMQRTSAVSRILCRVRILDNGCVVYTGRLTKKGYVHIKNRGKMRFGHRIIYEHFIGPIPEGEEPDHTCSRRACINPFHLDPVSHAENVRRGRAGHDWRTRKRNARGRFEAKLAVEKGIA